LGEFRAQIKRSLKLGLVWEPKWSLGNWGYKAPRPYEIEVAETGVCMGD